MDDSDLAGRIADLEWQLRNTQTWLDATIKALGGDASELMEMMRHEVWLRNALKEKGLKGERGRYE